MRRCSAPDIQTGCRVRNTALTARAQLLVGLPHTRSPPPTHTSFPSIAALRAPRRSQRHTATPAVPRTPRVVLRASLRATLCARTRLGGLRAARARGGSYFVHHQEMMATLCTLLSNARGRGPSPSKSRSPPRPAREGEAKRGRPRVRVPSKWYCTVRTINQPRTRDAGGTSPRARQTPKGLCRGGERRLLTLGGGDSCGMAERGSRCIHRDASARADSAAKAAEQPRLPPPPARTGDTEADTPTLPRPRGAAHLWTSVRAASRCGSGGTEQGAARTVPSGEEAGEGGGDRAREGGVFRGSVSEVEARVELRCMWGAHVEGGEGCVTGRGREATLHSQYI